MLDIALSSLGRAGGARLLTPRFLAAVAASARETARPHCLDPTDTHTRLPPTPRVHLRTGRLCDRPFAAERL